MTFKRKLQLFLFPAILLPAVVVIAINFIITGYNIRDMHTALLEEMVKSVIEKCAAEHKMIISLGMDKVEFYREATKKLTLEELRSNTTTSGSLTIVDTHTLAIVFSTDPETEQFFQQTQAIQRMAQQQRGAGAYRVTSQAGRTLTAFAVYAPWNWLVIGHVDTRVAYQYLYDAIAVSALIIGLFAMLFFTVTYRWSHRVTRSLELLEHGTVRLAEHDFDVVLEISGEDEFGRLAKSFNMMAAEINHAQRELKIAVQKTEDARQALESSLQWNQAIIVSMPDLLFTFDQTGIFLDCHTNDPSRLFMPKAQFLGKKIVEVMPSDVAAKSLIAIAAALDTGVLQTFEYRLDMLHERRWFESRMMRLKGDTVLAIARDITDRKQSEEQLKQHNCLLEEAVQQKQREMEGLFEKLVRQEKLATIGQMAGSIAHELRNPLGAVKQSVYYLKRLAQMQALNESNPKVLHHLEIMNTELNASERVIADLLNMTRMKPAQRIETDFRALLADAITQAHLPESVRVTIELHPGPLVIYADPLQLRQVLLNVLTNAAQALEGDGAISISAQHLIAQQEAVIEIHDTGVGLTPEALQQVFEPLYTTKANGTGLGLTICKQIIESYQGRISLTSQPGQGTTVTIILPQHEM